MKHSSRKSRLVAGLALLGATTLALSACQDSNSADPGTGTSASGGAKPISVALITKDNNNPFFVAMQKGADEAGAKNGVTITKAAGAKDGDEDGQVKAIEAAVARGDKGILITPNGPGVNSAIDSARQAGLYVIALDTPPDPADTVDITFATDNFKAGELIGKWAAAQLDGKQANIALLDLFNDKVVSVDYNRDQGFLTGMGIDVKDKKKNGDEDKTGSYTGGKGGQYSIACNEPTQGAQDEGKSAMENCLSKTKDINVVYTINEPAAVGAAEALSDAGVKGALVVSVDGGCSPGLEAVKDGTIGATSQQYPVKMAELGVEAIKKIADSNGSDKPAVTPGLDFFDTGVSLVTDKKVDGLDSISVSEGEKLCWGK
ncbi:substrate-binding domain-containing protein [uncultured Friedmanniella sp.]|uniref:substrate-binding domain-containing protein n=1 Tax=uncultured Friedmanniella sp. TaxID=335381 RepID=UPI0035CBDBE7